MKKHILILVIGVFVAPILQAQHFFKFAVPAEKTYDDKVVFKSDEGYFTKNENGNYAVPSEKIARNRVIYAMRNNQIIDSFKSNNLYNVGHLLADGHDFSDNNVATWESLKVLKNLSYSIMDEGTVQENGIITKLTLVIYREKGTKTKTFSMSEDNKDLKVEDLLQGESMGSGDLVILTGITANFNGVSRTVPGFTIQIVTEEYLKEVKATKEFTKTDKTIKTYNTTHKEGYYIKGKVLENNQATFDEINLGTSSIAQDIANILKSASITGMVGAWEIYLPTGQLYAKGTITYNPEMSTYRLDNNWVVVEKKELGTK